MAEAENKGKTLWEMFLDRMRHHENGNGATLSFYNPLNLQIRSPVRIPYANGPEFADHDFSVQAIHQYVRHISGQEFTFTDYVLQGVNTKTFDADQALQARIRAVPNKAGAYDAVLLRLFDEFAFAETFLAVLKDTTGIFEITDDKTLKRELFKRINGLLESYEASVLVITETTPDGKAPSRNAPPVELEYWDYWRDAELGGGKTAKEFLFVEMNAETGWFQIWRGREFFADA